MHDTPAQGGDPVAIARDAIGKARNAGFETVILDTAGRLAIDEKLMGELRAVRDAVKPRQTIFVADAMTGQDAVAVAKGFRDGVGIDGVVLSKMEGDARRRGAVDLCDRPEAAALRRRRRELDALEVFHPDRVASRILGMGDMLSLIEKAQSAYDQKQAEKLQESSRRTPSRSRTSATSCAPSRRWARSRT